MFRRKNFTPPLEGARFVVCFITISTHLENEFMGLTFTDDLESKVEFGKKTGLKLREGLLKNTSTSRISGATL